MPESLTTLEARRAEVTELLEEMTAMGVYEGTLNVLRSRARKLDGDITAEKARHRKVDPFKQVIGFRGGKVPETVIPREFADEATRRLREHRENQIRTALLEEGAHPDAVVAMGDGHRVTDQSTPPIPDEIMDRVRRRIADGEFDHRIEVHITQEGQ